MLSIKEATEVVRDNFPLAEIVAHIEYGDLFVFHLADYQPGEEDMDPFHSVNRQTGEMRDFSILTDGNPREIQALFIKAKAALNPSK